MIKQVYCDNGSTSFPKAPDLGRVMGNHIDNSGFNISRGGYTGAYNVEGEVLETYDLLGEILGASEAKNIVFTPGATWGLNMVVQGLLKPGDHVITTSMEHNAVVRPIAELEKSGVEWSKAQTDNKGNLDPKEIKDLIKDNTKLILITHGSNVCGTITSIEEVGRIAKEEGIFFVVDGAQTVGSKEINVTESNIDGFVFPGHKALLGPQGIGGIVLSSNLAEALSPVILGGTGSLSDKEFMPDFMPDKFQPGTMNIPGIIGLKHSLNFIKNETIEKIQEKKSFLTSAFLERVLNMERIRVIGRKDTIDRTSVVSIDFTETIDNAEVTFLLEREYGVLTRCGLHCALHAHQSFGTYPCGTVRFSFGYFNTEEEIIYVADAINKILKENR